MDPLFAPHDLAPSAPAAVLVERETLHLLSGVLQAAFRTHCTHETLGGKGPWQLVDDVQRKLAGLARCRAGLVSEERLARFIDAPLPAETQAAGPDLKLVRADAAEDMDRDS